MDVKSWVRSIRPGALFGLAAGIIAIVSAIALMTSLRLMNSYKASDRSQQALLELDYFLSSLKDVEAGARGYAITRDPQFLEPYHAGTTEVRRRNILLRELARTEHVLARRLGTLEALADRRRAFAEDVVRLAEDISANRQLVAALSAGNSAMEEVRREASEIAAELQRTYTARRRLAERWALIANAALVAGVALSLLVLIWLFTRMNREVLRRKGVEGELRELNSELEQRVQERTTEVKRARDLLDQVVENLPDLVMLKKRSDDGFEYMLINSAGEKLLGRDRKDVIGKSERDLFPADEVESVIKANNAVLESGRPRRFTDRKLTTAFGVRTVETRMVPIEDNGRSLLLAIVRDVTDAKASEEQLRQLQRLESVGRLTGGIAHDFNNLLAVTVGSVELIREQLPDGSDLATFADEAIGAGMRGAELVKRLLAFARKQHLEPTAVALNERIPHIVPLLQRTLGENIQVQVNSADSLWRARVDPTQVDDALVNMAINARDAMPNGGKLTIETANVVLDEDYAAHHMEVDPGEYVMLAVSDTGAGMSEEVIVRAFEPFFTTKPEGKGTGLGLSQVFGWVKQSSGHIKIYSELGHGTTIKLYLPRAVALDEVAVDQQIEEMSTRGNETILVVEDNPKVGRTVKRQLTSLGYSVLEVENAEMALDAIRSGTAFDLMMTDIVMPGGMNGYELAREAEQIRPSIRVIFTSGYTELAAHGLQAGRKGPLLSKPYTKLDLGRAIRSALDHRGAPPASEVTP
jgi:PAS domain S-box-containing protein